jgi:hypothetical protein
MVRVNREKALLVGEVIKDVVSLAEKDPFTDQRYYPPENASREQVTMYFLVMVAMDHRLSRPGRPYEGYVDGELYHGADLLYRLGRKRLDEDPDFFTAERLSRITKEDVLNWLSVEGPRGRKVRPPDPDVRAELLRDLGTKLMLLYEGSAYKIIVDARGYLRRGHADGIIDRLKVFKAYQDPVEKKAFLLMKFLERRGVFIINDPHNKEVPVDNHLVRIALRLGIVEVDKETLERIAGGIPFLWEEDVILRLAVRRAYKLVSQAAGVDPFVLDDFLWSFGRKCCTRDDPVCRRGCDEACRKVGGCRGGGCSLRLVCRAYEDPLLLVPEHNYINTWYY